MGIITRIEDKLCHFVENPFVEKDCFDLTGIEVLLKRAAEKNRKNVLGRILVPNFIEIRINENIYDDNEIFLEEFRTPLNRSMAEWMSEKGYEMTRGMEIHFIKDRLERTPFEISVFFKKMDKGGIISEGMIEEDKRKEIVGWFICEKMNQRFGICEEFSIIGRGEDCTIRIDDPAVSRRHASIEYKHGSMILEDLGSRMGSRVNHEKVQRKVLSHGDTVLIGHTKIEFLLKPNPHNRVSL